MEKYNPNFLQVEKNLIASLKEINTKSFDEFLLNQILIDKISQNPIIENGQYKLMHFYRYVIQQVKNGYIENLSNCLWKNYMTKLKEKPSKEEKKEEEKKEEEKKIEGPAEGPWDFFNNLTKWKATNSWEYTELSSLFKLGAPKELRPEIWTKLMSLYRSGNEEPENISFSNYLEKSATLDSLVYQQMEKDILELNTAENEIPQQTIAGVLKMAKAFYAWCLNENSKQIIGKTTSYGKHIYYKS